MLSKQEELELAVGEEGGCGSVIDNGKYKKNDE